MKRTEKVLLIINYAKEIPTSFVSELLECIEKENCESFILSADVDNFMSFGLEVSPSEVCDENLSEIDMAIVLGGDGSIIRASQKISLYGIPILGINFGHLGYLADLEVGDITKFCDILQGDYVVEERMMLQAKICRANGSEVLMPLSLNDIVISNGPVAKLLRYSVCLEGNVVQRMRADGLIVATPTGSTAYSMSAGGPILSPLLDAFCLTPICSHSLNSRPVILPGDNGVDIVEISAPEGNSVYVTVDGITAERLSAGDFISVRRADTKAKIVRMEKNGFLSVLKSKF